MRCFRGGFLLSKKILFVDDESVVVLLMKRRLEHGGYIVITAESGQDGLLKAKKEKPDLIVADHTMPEMTGLELCKIIKNDPVLNAHAEECDKSYTSRDTEIDTGEQQP